MSILEHLDALRRVLIVSLISVIPGSILGWTVREQILDILVAPVKELNYDLVFIGATEALTAHLKIAVVAGLVFASPIIAFQFWRFVLPALHANEKRYIVMFVPASVLLFAGGMVFAYYSVYTYAIRFLLSFGGEGLSPMLSLSKYLSFSIWFLLPFGVIFELPLVVLVLARLGFVTPRFLGAKRKWAFLAAFVISAVVTPTTDMLTQGIMAGAMYLLYEISIWLAYLVRPRRKIAATADSGTEAEAETEPEAEAETEPEAEAEAEAESDTAGHTEEQERNEPPEDAGPDTGTERREGNNARIDGGDGSLEDIYRDIVDRGNNQDR